MKLGEINKGLNNHSPVKTPDEEEHGSGSFSISSETGLLKPTSSEIEGQGRLETPGRP